MKIKTLILALAGLLTVTGTFAQNTKKYGIVNFSASYLRAEPDYEAPLETQALMGTVLEILDTNRYWLKVRTPEPEYTAWTNELGIVAVDSEGLANYLHSEKYICTAERTFIFAEPNESSARVAEIVMGDLVLVGHSQAKGSKPEVRKGFCKVALPSGREGYVKQGCLEDFQNWANTRKCTADNVIRVAHKMLGVPYFWGGTTVKGVDCSGLTRTSYLMNGVLLPRNASQQVKCGDPVDVSGVPAQDFSALMPGDLLFFGNKDTGRVSHVALYIGNGRIIHSSQAVQINSLHPSEPDYYGGTVRLLYARRIIGKENDGKGAKPILRSEYYFPKKQ